jgi:hypothetical protein
MAQQLTTYQQAYKAPIVGPWVAHLGGVFDAFATPCAIEPWLWVLAAWAAAPRLIYLFTKPFIQAEVAYRGLPNACGQRKGIVKRFADALDIAEPEVDVPEGLGWAGFRIAGDLALKAFWYAMVADRVTEFLFNWASLPYEWEGCKIVGNGWAQSSVKNAFTAAGGSHLSCWGDNHWQLFHMTSQSITVPSGYVASCGFGIAWASPPGHPDWFGWCDTRLVDGVSGAVGPWVSPKMTSNGTMASNYWFRDTGDFAGPHEYFIECSNFVGLTLYIGSASFQAYGHAVGEKGLLFDP